MPRAAKPKLDDLMKSPNAVLLNYHVTAPKKTGTRGVAKGKGKTPATPTKEHYALHAYMPESDQVVFFANVTEEHFEDLKKTLKTPKQKEGHHRQHENFKLLMDSGGSIESVEQHEHFSVFVRIPKEEGPEEVVFFGHVSGDTLKQLGDKVEKDVLEGSVAKMEIHHEKHVSSVNLPVHPEVEESLSANIPVIETSAAVVPKRPEKGMTLAHVMDIDGVEVVQVRKHIDHLVRVKNSEGLVEVFPNVGDELLHKYQKGEAVVEAEPQTPPSKRAKRTPKKA